MKIAFYKASGKFFDKLIRWWTSSPYSHCELVFSDGSWFTSSIRDGGVRFKPLLPDYDAWDYIEVPVDTFDEERLRRWGLARLGKKYDWIGAFIGAAFSIPLEIPDRYFCSEICVEGLQYIGKIYSGTNPSSYTPQKLYDLFNK
jgi:hypothetical protein